MASKEAIQDTITDRLPRWLGIAGIAFGGLVTLEGIAHWDIDEVAAGLGITTMGGLFVAGNPRSSENTERAE